MATQPGDNTTDSSAVWQRNWRRVASTHSLQDLLEADAPADPAAPMSMELLAVGVACVLLGLLFLVAMPFWLVGSKLLPSAGSVGVLEWLRNDEYYGPLVVLTVPVMLAAVFLHWLALKLFKHNY
jgi:phosphatidylinositol glycan anchor class Y biosynthesis protein